MTARQLHAINRAKQLPCLDSSLATIFNLFSESKGSVSQEIVFIASQSCMLAKVPSFYISNVMIGVHVHSSIIL
jgi:hypothetical protein